MQTLVQAPPLDALEDPAFWRALNPALHVCDDAFIGGVGPFDLDSPARESLVRRMTREGYFQFFVPPAQWQLPLAEMAQAVDQMPPTLAAPFVFVYDEFWLAFRKQARVIADFLGNDYVMLPDFWAWRVDPTKRQSGWKPHRDKGHMALFPDGRPKSLTVWIPLTKATPLNSCMYVIPADRDPTYGTPQDGEWKFGFSDVRALPGEPGDVFVWNQAVAHWGGHSSTFATDVRISVALEFQRLDVPPFNQPLLSPNSLPSLFDRLRLIAKQVLQYDHMYKLDPELERFARSFETR